MNARQANSIPIKSYLEAKGIISTKTTNSYSMFHAPYRDDNKASLKVSHRENLWIDFGTNEGGTLIDLVLKIFPGKNVSEAIKEISETTNSFFSFHQHKTLSQKNSDKEESRFGSWSASDPKHDSMSDSRPPKNLLAGRGEILSKNDETNIQYPTTKNGVIKINKTKELGNNPAINSYLQHRGIQIATAKQYCVEIYYSFNQKQYFGLAHRNNKGWSIRNKYWKGCTAQGYSYYNNKSNTLLIFEGIFDMLSLLELREIDKNSTDIMILNSLVNIKKALPILEQYTFIKLYLDHDEAGRKATREILHLYSNAEDASGFYHPCIDLNEYHLKKLFGRTEKGQRKKGEGRRTINKGKSSIKN